MTLTSLTWLGRYRVQLLQALRVTVAALLSLVVADLLSLPMSLWAVLTAIIVTQMSVGRSLKATIDYLSGTLGGAVYGAAIALLFPAASDGPLVVAALVVAVAPLAIVAAVNPNLYVAPITAAMVILLPGITHASPMVSAFDRVLEVGLGGVVGFLVSLLVMPSNAHGLAIEAAARTVDQLARALDALFSGLDHGLDVQAHHRIQDEIGEAVTTLETIAAEADREQSARLASAPDIEPLVRVLMRLRHDLVIIGRVALAPLPPCLRQRLRFPLAQVEATATDFLLFTSDALRARGDPPSTDAFELARAAYVAEIDAIRGAGLTRALTGDVLERFFALGFALEQLHENFEELERRAIENGRAHRTRGVFPACGNCRSDTPPPASPRAPTI